ncbi:hypothetical protein PHLGIDRAFT_38107 [Phlebiopsis gigantea 11061_1 CR5-6]|uniref:Uncharacterized protein n=1 Tax=Phlebiopsis gigantea (strain 11061_1 CR5-6) TaxID=745531 RepID=A0A0C3RZM2_PHLG1|nr:hypothetical protein PHLGIDRAFT_38107 [Phlebiopsis gigantea 11061_1 CR5-6]
MCFTIDIQGTKVVHGDEQVPSAQLPPPTAHYLLKKFTNLLRPGRPDPTAYVLLPRAMHNSMFIISLAMFLVLATLSPQHAEAAALPRRHLIPPPPPDIGSLGAGIGFLGRHEARVLNSYMASSPRRLEDARPKLYAYQWPGPLPRRENVEADVEKRMGISPCAHVTYLRAHGGLDRAAVLIKDPHTGDFLSQDEVNDALRYHSYLDSLFWVSYLVDPPDGLYCARPSPTPTNLVNATIDLKEVGEINKDDSPGAWRQILRVGGTSPAKPISEGWQGAQDVERIFEHGT